MIAAIAFGQPPPPAFRQPRTAPGMPSPIGYPACRLTHSNIRGGVHHNRARRFAEASSSTRKMLASSRENICGRTPQVGAEATAPKASSTQRGKGGPGSARTPATELHAMTAAEPTINPPNPSHAIQQEQQDFRKPFVVDPRLSETRERIRIGMKERCDSEHQLSGAQMPPDIGIRHAASGHGEQAHRQHGYKDSASCEKFGHYLVRTREFWRHQKQASSCSLVARAWNPLGRLQRRLQKKYRFLCTFVSGWHVVPAPHHCMGL